MKELQIAVIGAGLGGLTCARELRDAGAGVVVFEKSRSLGGRLATRRWEGQVVDHGAPWFTDVPERLRELCQDNLRCLTLPVLDWRSGTALPEPSGGRWYLAAGTNRLGNRLAEGLEVRLESQIDALELQPDGRWQVAGACFDAVVLTAPWPQSRRLLAPWLDEPAGQTQPNYRRALTALFEYAGDPSEAAMAWSGMEHASPSSGLERSLCENHKIGRVPPGRTVIVAHGTPRFSGENFDMDREAWAALLEMEVRKAWGLAQAPRAGFTHRWGFSTIDRPFEKMPNLPDRVYLAGDAVSGTGVGAVYRSGLTAARALLTGVSA